MLGRLITVSDDPWLPPHDPAGVKLLLVDAVDDMLLLPLPRPGLVGAHQVYLGGRARALDHVYDVVSVGDVEPEGGQVGGYTSLT